MYIEWGIEFIHFACPVQSRPQVFSQLEILKMRWCVCVCVCVSCSFCNFFFYF